VELANWSVYDISPTAKRCQEQTLEQRTRAGISWDFEPDTVSARTNRRDDYSAG